MFGTYSDGSRVRIIGARNGFTYITFTDGPHAGTSVKVPPSWVTPDDGPTPVAPGTWAPAGWTVAPLDTVGESAC